MLNKLAVFVLMEIKYRWLLVFCTLYICENEFSSRLGYGRRRKHIRSAGDAAQRAADRLGSEEKRRDSVDRALA